MKNTTELVAVENSDVVNQLYKNSTKHKGGDRMSMCKVCQLDSKKHSAKQWRLHQHKLKCTFCGKNSPEHSIELWEIHQKAVPTNSKLATMSVGFGPDTLAKIVKWNTVRVNGKDSSHHIEYVPVYMSCNGCGDAMSSTEANLADVLSSLCFKCFANITDQEYSWHSRR